PSAVRVVVSVCVWKAMRTVWLAWVQGSQGDPRSAQARRRPRSAWYANRSGTLSSRFDLSRFGVETSRPVCSEVVCCPLQLSADEVRPLQLSVLQLSVLQLSVTEAC